MSNIRWYILGAGSIGCLFAYKMREQNIPVTLLLKDEKSLEQFRLNGLRYTKAGDTQTIDIDAELTSEGAGIINRLLITTKAPQTLPAFKTLLPRVHQNTTIVLLQNGMGTYEELISLQPYRRLFNATTTEGAYQPERFHVVHAGEGNTQLGTLLPHLPEGAQQSLLNELGGLKPALQWHDDIHSKLWQKLVVNAAINPLTVLHDCQNGLLLKIDDARNQIRSLAAEFTRLFEAKSLPLPENGIEALVIQVIENTAKNYSSMWQDVGKGKPTEINYINGFLQAEADRLRIDMPTNQWLIQRLENKLAATG